MSDPDDIATDDLIDDVDTDADATDDAGADQLGDAGKKALTTMKGKLREERRLRREAEAKLAAKPADKDGDTESPEEIRRKAREEAAAEGLRDRVLDKIEAKAAKRFADPEDAVAILTREGLDDFIDGTTIDADAINDALDDLLKRKPHLAAQGGKRFEGSADQGSRKGKPRPAQLTKADLDRMSSTEIVAAKKAGQFDDLMGITR